MSSVCTAAGAPPVEFRLGKHIVQVQINEKAGLTFSTALRSILRQDPDVVLVGEIRDGETAQIAVPASLTGHLVLSTLHTNDSPSAITRLLELDVPAYLIRATLLGVMGQRLVRILCPHCKAPSTIDEETWNRLVAPWKANPPATTYRSVGCLECRNTGFIGRQGIYEILRLDDALHAAIRDDCDVNELRRAAIRTGMKTLRLAGARSWPVKAIEPNRSLLIVIKEPGVEVTWCFMLEEIDNKQTRLVLRVRSRLAMTPMLLLSLPIMYPGQYLMIRKMLLGIKQRAEAASLLTSAA